MAQSVNSLKKMTIAESDATLTNNLGGNQAKNIFKKPQIKEATTTAAVAAAANSSQFINF